MRLFDYDPDPTGASTSDSSILAAPSSGIGIAPSTSDGGVIEAPVPTSGASAGEQRRGGTSFGHTMQAMFMPWMAKFQTEQRDAGIRERAVKAKELEGMVSAMEHGVKMLDGLEGDQRQNAVKFYGDQLERLYPGMRDTFAAVANKPDMLTKFDQYMPHLPEHLQVLAKRDPKAFLRFAGTEEGNRAMTGAMNTVDLRVASKKVQAQMIGTKTLLPPDVAERYWQDGVITSSEIFDMQQYLPDNVRLNDKQLSLIKENDKTFWTGLGVLSGENEQKVLEERAKKPKNRTLLSRLVEERDGLEEGDPMRKTYDDMIGKVSQHRPAAGTSSKPAEDKPPKPAAPRPPTPTQERRDADAERTVEGVDARVGSMLDQLQKNAALVGPAGAVRRTAETAVGVVAPGIDTPAIDYQQNLKLLLADVRKMVEKDPNLSNEERRNLMETIGGGTFQTSGSAMRALNEVNNYVKGKRKGAGEFKSAEDVRAAFQAGKIDRDKAKAELKRFGYE